MKAFLKSLDEKLWYFVVNGWKALAAYSDGFEIFNPMYKWTNDEITISG